MKLLPGSVEVTIKESTDFDCIIRATAVTEFDDLEIAAYSSCGKTWNDDSLSEAWISYK